MKLADSILTLGKVALKSRRVSRQAAPASGPLIIMGNGPSLRDTIDKDFDRLQKADTMAVNFAANTPEFFRLKPRHYVLADPHFFSKESDRDPNVRKLWQNIERVDWPMLLHVPARFASTTPGGSSLTVTPFNTTPAEGYEALCHRLYRRGLAMPRPRNVLIPAIMEGIRAGYKDIYIAGADHTWPHTLYVDDANRVVTVQPHFYKEDPKELDRIAEVYGGIRLHEVLGSMVVAFRSYHAIRRFADREGVNVYNATPGSLIDAFTRRCLPD